MKLPRTRCLVLLIALFAVMVGLTESQTSAQDPTLKPFYGSITLKAGFQPDPHVRSFTAGGPIRTNKGGVNAYVAKAPDFRLNYTAGSYPLSFYSHSKSDTTLLIRLPNGQWVANDDGGKGLHPHINLKKPKSGTYDIYVGTYGKKTAPAVLYITEYDSDPTPSDPHYYITPILFGELEKGHPTNGFRKGKHHITWRVTLNKGVNYIIDMKSEDTSKLDSYLGLQDEFGKLLIENDDNKDNKGSLNSRITYTPTKTAEYQIVASSYGDKQTGKFNILFNQPVKVYTHSWNQYEKLSVPEGPYVANYSVNDAKHLLTGIRYNRLGYNVLYMHPLFHNETGADKNAYLFQHPSEFKKNYKSPQDNNLHPSYLDLEVVSHTSGQIEYHLFHSEEQMQRSIGGNLGLGINITGLGSKSTAFNYQEKRKRFQSDHSFYKTAYREGVVYTYRLIPSEVKLTASFRKALLALPIPSGTAETLRNPSQSTKDRYYTTYRNFFSKWGTHYPLKISYGGKAYYEEFEDGYKIATEFAQEWGVTDKASVNIPKTPVSLERELGFNSSFMKGSSKKETWGSEAVETYGGGAGDTFSKWKVDRSNAAPMKPQLAPIWELARPNLLIDKTNQDWSRVIFMHAMLHEYIKKEKANAIANQPPRAFLFKFKQLKCVNNEDAGSDAEIFGKIAVAKHTSSISTTTGTRNQQVVWERTRAGYIALEDGAVDPIPPNQRLLLVYPDSNGKYNKNAAMITVIGRLWEYDPGGNSYTDKAFGLNIGYQGYDDLIDTFKGITLADFEGASGSGWKSITIPLREDHGDMDIVVQMREIPLQFRSQY